MKNEPCVLYVNKSNKQTQRKPTKAKVQLPIPYKKDQTKFLIDFIIKQVYSLE